jgi:hypothetical protein
VGADTRRIEDEIRAERQQLDRNLHALESKARALTDWRGHYSRHAGAALAIAFGLGVLLGTGGRRGTASRTPMARPHTVQAGFNPLRIISDNPRARQQVDETWQNILETLVAMAAAKAIQWIGSFVPGFRDEYDARQAPPALTRS